MNKIKIKNMIDTELIDLKQMNNLIKETIEELGSFMSNGNFDRYRIKWKEILSFACQKSDELEEVDL